VKVVVVGSQGRIGARLMRAFPGAIGIDRRPGADVVVDLADADYGAEPLRGALAGATTLIHLAAGSGIDAPDAVHWQAIGYSLRLLLAAQAARIGHLIVASSDWAGPGEGLPVSVYGHSRRVLEALAAMYGVPPRRATVIRVGWVPASVEEVATAPDWLAANHWSDERLLAEFRQAIGGA